MSCATDGCPNKAPRLGIHCPSCEREIVGAIESTHGPLVGAEEQSDLFPTTPPACACGRTPARYHADLKRVACARCAAMARGT